MAKQGSRHSTNRNRALVEVGMTCGVALTHERLPPSLSSFEREPLRPQQPDPLHNVWRVTVSRVRIHQPLEHNSVLLGRQINAPAQRFTGFGR
ncbi:hypothetical protein BSP239C_03046 [Brevibacterium sp. 239c]|nr:hypothetical protein BSP239C_03046 [Brevibacterium sp. 239c]